MSPDDKKDLLELGAILQRDKQTYAIAPHIPGGIITDTNVLRKIADTADKYGCSALKLTSAQRIAMVGIRPEELEAAWNDLDMEMGHAIGVCVRSIKICPGTTFCKRAQQDSVSLGLKLDKMYHGMELPGKLKMGVSGCMNSCAESAIKDIGLMGTLSGFTILVGGAANSMGRLGQVVAQKKNEEESLEIVERIIDLYKSAAKKGQRMGKFVEKVGLELIIKYIESAPEELDALKEQARVLNPASA